MSHAANEPAAVQPAAPKRQLNLFDSTCIIVGIIIGAGIYESSPLIASNVPNVGWLFGAWILGGAFALVGALCYAELATAYPEEGGDYVYLTRAFGRAPGFLFAWAQVWVIRPGSIGAMAYVFARYSDRLWPISQHLAQWYRDGHPDAQDVDALLVSSQQFGDAAAMLTYAVISVLVLTGINILGVRQGKWTQNLLTMAKVLGLAMIFVAGMFFSGDRPSEPAEKPAAAQTAAAQAAAPAEAEPATAPIADSPERAASPSGEASQQKAPSFLARVSAFLAAFGFAMIFVLFTYGGWNEMAYVGAEVRNPQKNILRALVLGTVAVTIIYVLVTLAFVHALGFEGTQRPKHTAAEDVLNQAADKIFRLSERVKQLADEGAKLQGDASQEAEDRRAEIADQAATLYRLGQLPGHMLCVLISISALGAVNGMIFTGARVYYAMGTEHRVYAWLGRWNRTLGTPVSSLAIQALISLALVVAAGLLQMRGLSEGGFSSMVIFTAPAFWFFLVLVGLSVAELRDREPDTPRPYRVPGYPITPILFCLSSIYMLYSTLIYAVEHRSWEALWSIVILLLGVAMAFLDPRPRKR